MAHHQEKSDEATSTDTFDKTIDVRPILPEKTLAGQKLVEKVDVLIASTVRINMAVQIENEEQPMLASGGTQENSVDKSYPTFMNHIGEEQRERRMYVTIRGINYWTHMDDNFYKCLKRFPSCWKHQKDRNNQLLVRRFLAPTHFAFPLAKLPVILTKMKSFNEFSVGVFDRFSKLTSLIVT